MGYDGWNIYGKRVKKSGKVNYKNYLFINVIKVGQLFLADKLFI